MVTKRDTEIVESIKGPLWDWVRPHKEERTAEIMRDAYGNPGDNRCCGFPTKSGRPCRAHAQMVGNGEVIGCYPLTGSRKKPAPVRMWGTRCRAHQPYYSMISTKPFNERYVFVERSLGSLMRLGRDGWG